MSVAQAWYSGAVIPGGPEACPDFLSFRRHEVEKLLGELSKPLV